MLTLPPCSSKGLTGSMKAGDVQWMTAGSGVVHSEMPSQEILEKGGTVHGFQIWLNLPRQDKGIQ
jgi:redox-sensitive bicupin YhaK (pirin superfamily)